MRRLALLVALVAGATLAWILSRERPGRPDLVRLVPHENVLAALIDGELVRTTTLLDPGTQRGQAQTTEADPRDGARASGVLSRPDGEPPYAWLVGERPSLALDVLQPQDRELLVYLMNGTSTPQPVEVWFNDQLVGRGELPVGEKLVAVAAPVPAAIQRRGSNRVELRFAHTELRPLVDTDRPLPLAAVLQRVVFAPPGLTRAQQPPPPARAGVVEELVDGRPASMLLLPPETAARAALRLPDAPRVTLRLTLHELHAPLELSLQLDGGRQPLRTFQPGSSATGELEFDLTPWAGEAAVLELWAREARGGGELGARVGGLHVLVPESWQAEGAAAPPIVPAPVAQRPSFLVIVLDAFARRYLMHVADGQLATPALGALVANALHFEDATAPASYTLPSVASLLTGQSPLTHGLLATTHGGVVSRLPPDAPSLVEELRARGWRTAAWMTNPNGGARHGFARGFERFEELFDPSRGLFREGRGVSGQILPAQLAEYLQQVEGQPFFAYVHVFEPHAPYEAPADLSARFVQPYAGPVSGSYDWITAFRTGQAGCDDAGWRHLRELYAARAALADRILGRLLNALVRAGRDDDTIVVVLSDHGESLGERGLLEHGDAVPPEQIESLLVLGGGGVGEGRRSGPATVQDVAPTLLRLAGLQPLPGMEGVDLLAGELDPDRPLAAISSVWLPELSWQHGDLRLVVDLFTRRVRLYDTALDPGQLRDVSAERPASRALLLRELTEHVCAAETARAARPADDPGASPLDAQSAEQLAELGYAAGLAPAGAIDEPLRLGVRLRRLQRRL